MVLWSRTVLARGPYLCRLQSSGAYPMHIRVLRKAWVLPTRKQYEDIPIGFRKQTQALSSFPVRRDPKRKTTEKPLTPQLPSTRERP